MTTTAGPLRYRTSPVHVLPGLEIAAGYDALAVAIRHRIEEAGPGALVAIDGFAGTRWSPFADNLRGALERAGVAARWLSTAGCFLPATRIEEILAPTLTADPVFGRLFRGHLEELWDAGRAVALRQELRARREPTIVYGFGASLLAESDLLIYLEVPKDRGQQLAARGLVPNIGVDQSAPAGAAYKRLYFVDWPMLNRIKRELLPRLEPVRGSERGGRAAQHPRLGAPPGSPCVGPPPLQAEAVVRAGPVGPPVDEETYQTCRRSSQIMPGPSS